MESLLKFVVGGLVQYPDQVRITNVARRSRYGREDRASGGAPSFDLRVAPADFPRIVGRGGRTAKALRVLLECSYVAQGGDDDDRPGLNITDPEDDGSPV